jgi:hypothetical protein
MMNHCFLGRVDDVDGDVDGLDNAGDGVDGDEEHVLGEQRVVEPQHCALQSHHVQHRLERLGRLLLVNAVKRRPACVFFHAFSNNELIIRGGDQRR